MSNNSEGSSKRKRENKSIQESEEIRRSARQKDKNHIPILQRAMNLKSANFLESNSLNSTQNRRQANDQTNVVQLTPAAIGQQINQSGSHNFNLDHDQTTTANDQTNALQPAPAAICPQINQSGSHSFNSSYDQTTTGHIHNVYEQQASRLNPLAPEFRLGSSNNYAHQNTVQSYQNQQPFMTDASRSVNQSYMAGSRRSINQAAQPVQFVHNIATLNSHMKSSDASRSVNQSYMAGSRRSINHAAQPVQFVRNIAALSSHAMSSDPSQRVIHPIAVNSCNLTKEDPQPCSNTPVDQNMQASLYYQMLSSQRDSSQRVDHPIMADSFILTNEAPQRSSNGPIDQNMQASLYYQMLSSQRDASRRANQSRTAGFHHSINQAAQSVQYVPSTGALNSQMLSPDASRRVNHSQTPGLRHSISQAAQQVQFVPSTAALNSQMMSSDSSKRVDHPAIGDSCNLTNEALQPSSRVPVDQNIQASLHHLMLSSQCDSSQRVDHPIMANSCKLTNEARQPSSNRPIDQNIPASLYYRMLSSQRDSSQRVDHPIMADSCNLTNEARQPSSIRPIDQNIPASLYHRMLSSQRGVPQHKQSPSSPIVDSTSNAIQFNPRYPNIGAHGSKRNNYPVLGFAAPSLNKSVTFDPQMNYSLPRDVSVTKAGQYGLVNPVNHDAGSRSSEINSSNSGRRNLSSIAQPDYDAINHRLQLEAELRRSMLMPAQTQTQHSNARRKQNVTPRMKPKRKEEQPVQPAMTDHIKMEGGNPLASRPPSPPKLLGERCQLCKIDLAFTPKGVADPQSSALPFSAVLPCGHAYHDQCLRDLFGDKEPPCVECLDSHNPGGC